MTKRDILTDAAVELGILDPGDTLGSRETYTLEQKFDRLLDRWNAKRQAVYADRFDTFTLTANLSPHTIGPTGATWTMTQRPVSIEGASVLVTSGAQTVYQPIQIRDKQWYDAQRVPGLASLWPRDVFYNPTFPNGTLYFFPVGNTAYQVRLLSRLQLAALTLDSDFTMPPGYRDAVVWSLAEAGLTSFAVGGEDAARIADEARKARGDVFGNNTQPPRIATRDAGMPRGRRSGKTFIFQTRQM